MTDVINTKPYMEFLDSLKKEIQQARFRSHLAVNKEIIHLYWKIGKGILDRQQNESWGSKVIEQVSQDLRHSFPEMKGLSVTNLKYMRMFAGEYSLEEISQQPVDQLPWGHHVALFSIQDKQKRIWYIQKTVEQGWSRNVLVMQIDSNLYERQGRALTNFKDTLPSPTSDLAQQIFKNEYNFEFLNLDKEAHERVIERSLINHIRDFLLELGTGFAFLGNQYKVTVGDEDFYLDLLFYHTRLSCYVILELKVGKFKPEYAGKLNFYLTAIDRQVKLPDDNPTIGLLLCQQAHDMVVEYALSEIRKPLGVAEYRTITEKLPKDYEQYLPTPEQFKHLLDTLPLEKEDKVNE